MQTLLLIDDSPTDRAIYKRFLLHDVRQNYQIVEFGEAEEAIIWCQENFADIILLDYNLPQINGLEFLQHLRQLHPQLILPVIFMTGLGNTAVAVEALKLGAQDYIEKDQITKDSLPRLVRSVAQQVQFQRQLARQQAQQQTITEIALWMRQSLDPQRVLDGTTQAVRQFLQADRVLAYQLAPDGSGVVVAESVGSDWPIALGQHIEDTCFQNKVGMSPPWTEHPWAIADITQANLTDCHRALLERFAVKANLVAPI